MDITIKLGVWMVPIVGFVLAYIVKNSNPGGVLPDVKAEVIAAAIFLSSVIFTGAYYLGQWLGG